MYSHICLFVINLFICLIWGNIFRITRTTTRGEIAEYRCDKYSSIYYSTVLIQYIVIIA